ncbi:MAG: desulfoferrodoxin Dfx [Erysipelotrichaceae bacterium]|nr:desulfoferrodoxin Dfx [Erysipelotrichaceae bacterium]
MKFYKCNHCQNLIEMVDDRKVNPVCCGEKMMELVPGKIDASLEKHVPVVEIKDGVVEVMVGSVAHPMTEEHLIEWIVVETEKGVYRKNLKAGDAPMARFMLLDDEKVVNVYAYCNLHGLWQKN